MRLDSMRNFDIEDFPDGTDQVIVAMHPDNIEWDDDDDFDILSNIAARTNLSKDQVRYRIQKLELKGYVVSVEQLHLNQGHAPIGYMLGYKLVPIAEQLMRTEKILGQLPEEPTKKDLLNVIDHIQDLEADIEEMRDDIESIKDTMVY